MMRDTLGDEHFCEGRARPPCDSLEFAHWIGGGYVIGGYSMPVLRYRIRKPRALIALRQLIATLPERVDT